MTNLLSALHPNKASSTLPAFLGVPLSSDSAFSAISRQLNNREYRRQELGAPTCQVDQSGKPKLVLPSNGCGEAGADAFSVNVGQAQINANKNRYCNIIAYDRTRLLPPDNSEYVNASLVREPDLGIDPALLPRRWWIAAQAPTPPTRHAFLSALLTPPTSPAHAAAGTPPLPPPSLLLQLTPLVERNQQKAHPYFPGEVGQTAVLRAPEGSGARAVWVRLDGKSKESASFRRSDLTVGWEGEEEGRRVVHIEYLGWSDHGVPEDASELLSFLTTMTRLNLSLSPSPDNPSPILVHCSAGVGRTGTYITIASLLPLLILYRSSPGDPTPRSGPPLQPLPTPPTAHPLGAYPASAVKGVERDFVGLTIDGLREQRTTMVQTAVQVRWCFEALAVAWREGVE